MEELYELHHELVYSDNDTHIEVMLEQSNAIAKKLGDSADTLY